MENKVIREPWWHQPLKPILQEMWDEAEKESKKVGLTPKRLVEKRIGYALEKITSERTRR